VERQRFGLVTGADDVTVALRTAELRPGSVGWYQRDEAHGQEQNARRN
jgi:hypothetical protein